MKVFLALEGRRTDTQIDYPHVLISAATLKGKRKNGFKRFKYHPNVKEIFLDSGGFSFFYKQGNYPFTPKELAKLGENIGADYVAVMDYPCEPDVSRPDGLATNVQRIERTIENAHKCMKYENVNWVMVIQGYTKEEYRYCIERIKEEGLKTDLMAIGSLCVRKKIKEALEIISLTRRHFRKLHGFGVDLRFLKDPQIYLSLYSSDTAAWHWNNQNHWTEDWKPRGITAKTDEDKLRNFVKYVEKLKKLHQKYNGQKRLFREVKND